MYLLEFIALRLSTRVFMDSCQHLWCSHDLGLFSLCLLLWLYLFRPRQFLQKLTRTKTTQSKVFVKFRNMSFLSLSFKVITTYKAISCQQIETSCNHIYRLFLKWEKMMSSSSLLFLQLKNVFHSFITKLRHKTWYTKQSPRIYSFGFPKNW